MPSICASCGSESPAGARFCMHCAAALPQRCDACAAEIPTAARFCPQCAHPVGQAGSPASPVEPRVREPSSYTPKHLAEKILQSKSALEGERKQVTVMFADVKGSMELAEQLDPEEWHRILERFFEILTEGVNRFEGTVNQYTGDGIMALFGAPIAHEDHAARACYAALHIRDGAREYANEVRSQHGVPFGVRVGLNSGEVVVGKIGDDLRMDYTAQGHTVGLAQRVEALAESGHICVSEDTARLVEGYFDFVDLGRTKIKGVEAPVGLFDLEGVGAFRTRLDRSRARGLSTFVGRDTDMAVLDAALERARAGNGQVVGVSADAGTGKSRLCAEFLDGCRARGIPIVEARGVAHGKSIPMLPMLELWRAFYAIDDDDSADETRAKIAGRLLMMDEGFREVLPIVFDVFGVPDPDHPAPAIEPEQRQKRLHGVIKRILHDPNYGDTRIFLLEDLHWFDGASDSFLETIIESAPATRDLVLTNFRPEYRASWMQLSYYQHLPLQPLGADAIRALLRDQLGDDPSVAALPEAIHAGTKGNPFFIEEVVQSLVEGGHLAGTRGAYRMTMPIDSLKVPASVQVLLAARIDRLPEREKHVLQTAAVIGKTFSEGLLLQIIASVTSLDEQELRRSLAALSAAEFLFEASLYPQLEYSFKHPLSQEVALGSQLKDRRIAVHAAVAQALEDAGGNLDEQAAEIAQHWAEAGNAARAVRWYRRAAAWAALSDPREGLGHWRRVRELAAGIDDDHERDERTLEACVELFSLGWRMGGSESALETVYEQGRALAERSGNRRSLARLVGFYGLMRNMVNGSAHDYVRYGEEAAALAAETGDPALRAGIGTLPAFGHMFAGDGRAMLEWVERVLAETGSDCALGKEISGYSPLVSMLSNRTNGLVYLGRLEEARGSAREARRVAEESQEFEVLGWIYFVTNFLAYTAGEAGSALDHGARSLEIAEQVDNESSRVLGYVAIGYAHILVGQPAAARDALLESVAIARAHRVQVAFIPGALATLSEAYRALGDRSEALAAAREAIELGHLGGCRYHEAQAQVALAEALLETDAGVPQAEIETALARAEELVEAVAGRGLAPRIVEVRGRLANALGDRATADRSLREARDLYRSIGATGHAERAAALLAESSG